MSRKKVSTTVYLDESQTKALAELHEVTKVPTAVRIRAALDLYILAMRENGTLPPKKLPGEPEAVRCS